jgi:membrane protease subunit HflC
MKAVLITVAVIILLVVLSQSLYAMDMTEQAIITQFGEYQKTVKSPGLHAKLPLVQVVHRYEKRIIASDAPAGEFLMSIIRSLRWTT